MWVRWCILSRAAAVLRENKPVRGNLNPALTSALGLLLLLLLLLLLAGGGGECVGLLPRGIPEDNCCPHRIRDGLMHWWTDRWTDSWMNGWTTVRTYIRHERLFIYTQTDSGRTDGRRQRVLFSWTDNTYIDTYRYTYIQTDRQAYIHTNGNAYLHINACQCVYLSGPQLII